MTQPEPAVDQTTALLAAAGIVVTAEGRARARRKLDEADAYWTPERRRQANADFDRRIAAA